MDDKYVIELKCNGDSIELEPFPLPSSNNHSMTIGSLLYHIITFKKRFEKHRPKDFFNSRFPLHIILRKNGQLYFTTESERFETYFENLKFKNSRSSNYLLSVAYLFGLFRFYQSNYKEFRQLEYLFYKNPELTFSLKPRGYDIMLNIGRKNKKFTLEQGGKVIEIDETYQEIKYLNQTVPFESIDQCFKDFIFDPLQFIKESNLFNKSCCFCTRELSSDSSILNGYGKVCSKNYNLPWIELSS